MPPVGCDPSPASDSERDVLAGRLFNFQFHPTLEVIGPVSSKFFEARFASCFARRSFSLSFVTGYGLLDALGAGIFDVSF